jgi:hypothetical protein
MVDLAPVLLLHALLLPINIYRLVEPLSPHTSKRPKSVRIDKTRNEQNVGISLRASVTQDMFLGEQWAKS